MNIFIYDNVNINRVQPVGEIVDIKNDINRPQSGLSFMDMILKAQEKNENKESLKDESRVNDSKNLESDTNRQSLIASYSLLNSINKKEVKNGRR